MQGKYFFITFCFAYLFSSVITITRLGACPNDVMGMNDFDPDMWQEIWYELEAPIFSVAASKKCSYFKCILTDENIFQTTYVTYSAIFGIKSSESAPVTIINSKMAQPENAREVIALGTDYTNYAVFYFCKNTTLGLFSDVQVRVLGHDRSLDGASQKSVDGILEKYGFSGSLVKINQKNCPARVD